MMKIEFNKDTKLWKKAQIEMMLEVNNSVTHIIWKTSYTERRKYKIVYQ